MHDVQGHTGHNIPKTGPSEFALRSSFYATLEILF